MSAPILVYAPSALPQRTCSAAEPMEDKNVYQWGHPDAEAVRPFFNLMLYRCPHCSLVFHAPMRPQ
jgi:hypothetical protein